MNSLFLIISRSRYLAPAIVFATLNVLFGTWAIYIPSIKSKLGIDEGQLGIAIFFMALGTLGMLVLAPFFIRKMQVGRATALGILGLLLVFVFLFVITTYQGLLITMFFVGLFSGFTDIAMNTLVTKIEKEDSVHIMSSNHGFFSLGGMIGAGIGTLFLPFITNFINYVIILVGLCILINVLLLRNYINIKADQIEDMSFNVKYLIPLLGFSIIGFCIMSAEGAIVDWSALYLEKISKAKLSWIGLGYTAFSATMAIGRFLGDKISLRLGSKSVITYGTIIGTIGFGLVLLVRPIIAIVGFGLVGVGFSVIVPELFRIAGKMTKIDASRGISIIAGSGFAGFLVGPVLLGFLADISSLKLSFFALLMFSVISFVTSLLIKNK